MNEAALQVEQTGSVATVWLNRSAFHNAFNATLIAELTSVFLELGADPAVRVIVLASRGRSFSAGADMAWMKEQGAASLQENKADAERLAEMFRVIAECSKPTVARVQGAAIGGGVGLVAACDIAIGVRNSVFAMSEVRLGLIPATIAPYVVRAIGARHARRLFQTGERIDAVAAERIGLLHEVVDPEAIDERLQEVIQALLAGAPGAQQEAKQLVKLVDAQVIDDALIAETAKGIAVRRATAEAGEGLSAFLEKRPASWVPQP